MLFIIYGYFRLISKVQCILLDFLINFIFVYVLCMTVQVISTLEKEKGYEKKKYTSAEVISLMLTITVHQKHLQVIQKSTLILNLILKNCFHQMKMKFHTCYTRHSSEKSLLEIYQSKENQMLVQFVGSQVR